MRTARKPAKKPAKKSAKEPSRSATSGKPKHAGAREEKYHHGDLHQALLRAAETVLTRDGLQGLTLRAVAREAGVSHAAPTHHFGDLSGLVSELAAIGFRRFNAAMAEAANVEGDANVRGRARAHAYVGYARANPQMYGLMFRTEKLDMMRPALRDAASASFSSLAQSVGAVSPEQTEDDITADKIGAIIQVWALMHGYTMLLLEGRLNGVFERSGSTPDSLLDAVLLAAIGRA